jgi:hypothetical protein
MRSPPTRPSTWDTGRRSPADTQRRPVARFPGLIAVTGCHCEIWERKGEKETQFTAACLLCNWIGSDTTHTEAVEEGEMHERGERHPWQMAPGTALPWSPGDPTMRPSD